MTAQLYYGGEVTTEDAAVALQMSVRCEYTQLSDLNGDHRITSLDALMLLQAASGAIEIA